jgi:hypothetical protein
LETWRDLTPFRFVIAAAGTAAARPKNSLRWIMAGLPQLIFLLPFGDKAPNIFLERL